MSADPTAPSTVTACFAVRAAADPGTLPRLLESFAKRGLVPSSVQARLTGEGTLAIDLQVGGLDRGAAEIVAEGLRQMVPVERVLLAELGLPALGLATAAAGGLS